MPQPPMPRLPVTIRPARVSETIRLHDLWLSAEDSEEWAPGEGPGGPLLAELDVLASARRLWAAFADDDGKVVGFAGAGEVDSALFITAFGVARDHRGKGCGAALLSAIVSFGTAANYPAIYAVTCRGGIGQVFLHGNGFVDLDVDALSPAIAAVVASAWEPERCLVMARPL